MLHRQRRERYKKGTKVNFNTINILLDLSMIISTKYFLHGMAEGYLLFDLYMISQQISAMDFFNLLTNRWGSHSLMT